MKRLLLALALAWSLSAFAQAPYQRNSLNTNVLGTNLVWDPTQYSLTIQNNNGSFTVLSNGLAVATISATPGGNGLPDLNLSRYLQFGSSSNRLTRSGANLLWDGLALNGGGTSTNYYSTIITTNLTVLNNLYASNFFSTNVTIQNNLYTSNFYATNVTVSNIISTSITVSNLYTVNGNHNTLIVTNALTLNSLKTNLLAVTSTGLITNANYGSGITWTPSTLTLSASSGTTVSVNATNVTTPNIQDTATVTWGVSGSNLTATATASGGSVSVNATNVTTPNLKDSADVTWSITTASNAIPAFAALTWNALTYSASNVVMDCSLGNSQVAHYKLLLTNSTTQFGIPTSIPTVPKTFWIWFQQDSTGVRTVQWTNTTFKFPQATQPVIDTNANAVTLIEFTTNPFTNSVLGYVGIVPRIQ